MGADERNENADWPKHSAVISTAPTHMRGDIEKDTNTRNQHDRMSNHALIN